jgi:hypothetical protein
MYRKLNWQGGTPREVSEVVNNLVEGKSNNTGEITLATGGATTTTITDERIGYNSYIGLEPVTMTAASTYFPYGAFQDSTDQTAAAIDVAYAMKLNTTDYSLGVSVTNTSRIKVDYSGLYNLQFSSQFVNTDTQIHDVSIWIRKNGTNVDGTNGDVSVPNSHGGTDGKAIAGWNYYIELAKDDYVELMWKTNSTQVSMQYSPAVAYSAGVTPAVPATASVIATLQYLSSNSYTTNLFTETYVSAQTKGSATITHPANTVSNRTYRYIIVG